MCEGLDGDGVRMFSPHTLLLTGLFQGRVVQRVPAPYSKPPKMFYYLHEILSRENYSF